MSDAGPAADVETRPLKPQRTDECLDQATISRDPQFYPEAPAFASADCCILQVEGVLFKVQRSLLTRYSAVFDTMFGLPLGKQPLEGVSDANPVVLAGDKASDFRALLKYLTLSSVVHRLRFQLILKDIPLDEFYDITAFGRMPHKYQMDEGQAWASFVLVKIVTKHRGALSTKDFVALFDLAMLLSREDLLQTVTAGWLKLVRQSALPSGDAMDVADKYKRREFLVLLYTHELSRLLTKHPLNALPATLPISFPTLHGLNPIHVQRILAAQTSLSICWRAFRHLHVLPRRGPACGQDTHLTNCNFNSHWLRAVTAAEKDFPLTKIRERVVRVQQSMRAFDALQLAPPSRSRANTLVVLAPLPLCTYSRETNDQIITFLASLPQDQSLEPYFFAAEPPSA
ncbi:hypothetical protein C8F01DRAFT_1366539 [Mycena amicta]|nr:hypothetical protein C8F01DRAFT_1366539 [Mycena amicta]